MPVTEPTRKTNLSAIPSFLREPGAEAPASKRALPRPKTPSEPPNDAATDPPLDPASLPMPSLSRRRVVTAAGVLLAGLLTLSFVRQVGEATAASDRAEELRAANAALRDEVARLQQDLGHVQDLHFIQLEGRAFGLGGRGEVPFALAAGAPALEANAPGSTAVRLGAPDRPSSPIDAWLEVLFGSGR
jgi:hypothetical protein